MRMGPNPVVSALNLARQQLALTAGFRPPYTTYVRPIRALLAEFDQHNERSAARSNPMFLEVFRTKILYLFVTRRDSHFGATHTGSEPRLGARP
jgi:hypothetical protein